METLIEKLREWWHRRVTSVWRKLPHSVRTLITIGGYFVPGWLIYLGFGWYRSNKWPSAEALLDWGEVQEVFKYRFGWPVLWISFLSLLVALASIWTKSQGRDLDSQGSNKSRYALSVATVVVAVSIEILLAWKLVPRRLDWWIPKEDIGVIEVGLFKVLFSPSALLFLFATLLLSIGLWAIVRPLLARELNLYIRPVFPYIKGWLVAGIAILSAVVAWYLLVPNSQYHPYEQLFLSSRDLLFFFCLLVVAIVLSFTLSRLLAPELGSLRVFLHTLLVASLLMLLLIGTSLFVIAFRDRYIEAKLPATEVGQAAENVLNLFSVFISIGAIGIGIWGFWLQSKMEALIKVEEQVNDLNGLAVIAAESTFAMLPDFSETQQIPDRSMRSLEALKHLIFDDPTQSIVTFLDKKGNGLRLRYARALYHFGEGDFVQAERVLREQVVGKGNDMPLDVDARYRLGICQRQMKKWTESIETFLDLSLCGSQTAITKARLGAVITLLAWPPPRDERERTEWVKNSTRVDRALGVTKEALVEPLLTALDLARKLYKEADDKAMVQAYFGKCVHSVHMNEQFGPVQFDDAVIAVEKARNFVEGNMPGDDNLAINYKMFLGWCYWFLAESGGIPEATVGVPDNQKLPAACIVKALAYFRDVEKRAKRYKTQAEESPHSDFIYSELDEREVRPEIIQQEASALQVVLPFLWAVNSTV
jgi:hypothetical protein